jgi:hypothetical protein
VEGSSFDFPENSRLLLHLFQSLLANLFFCLFRSFLFPFPSEYYSNFLSLFHIHGTDDDARACARSCGFSFFFRASVTVRGDSNCGAGMGSEADIRAKEAEDSSNGEADVVVAVAEALVGRSSNLPRNDANLVKLEGRRHC